MWEVVIRILGGFNNWRIIKDNCKSETLGKKQVFRVSREFRPLPTPKLQLCDKIPAFFILFSVQAPGQVMSTIVQEAIRGLLESSGGPPHEQQPGILGLGNMSTL